MSLPSNWFIRRLDGDTFTAYLVHADLELPFDKFNEFRRAVWSDVQSKGDCRVANAGFQTELDSGLSDWDCLQIDRDEDRGCYVVQALTGPIVGLIRIRRESDNVAVYANVLYAVERADVSPDIVFERICQWLRAKGIREVHTGRICGPSFEKHVHRCGFVNDGNGWKRSLNPG